MRAGESMGKLKSKSSKSHPSAGGLTPDSQHGFTLVEAVIAATVLSVTMLVASLAFITIVQLQQKAATVRQVQQSTRYILEAISRDIRNASAFNLSSPTDLMLSNSLRPNERIQYGVPASHPDSISRSRLVCDGAGVCNLVGSINVLSQGQIRVVEFRMSEVDNGNSSTANPIRVYIRAQQLADDLDEEDPYFYEYETSALVAPRR